jgi:hypothetical protein
VAWVIASSVVIAIVAGVIGFLVMIFTGFASGLGSSRGGPVIFPSGGWGGVVVVAVLAAAVAGSRRRRQLRRRRRVGRLELT